MAAEKGEFAMTFTMRRLAISLITFSLLTFANSFLFVATVTAQDKLTVHEGSNAQGNTKTTTDENGNVVDREQYDLQGNLVEKTTTSYDKEGRVTNEDKFDKNGQTSHEEIEYKGDKTICKKDKYKNGKKKTRIVAVRDIDDNGFPKWKWTEQDYDNDGNLIGTPRRGYIENSYNTILPDELYAQQPFSFAVTSSGSAEGEVVEVQTAEGMVVQSGRADHLGRVFLPAGLPAGAYLISLGSRDRPTQSAGKIEIKPPVNDTLERRWEHPPQPMQIQNPPQAVKLGETLSLRGQGFSPNFSKMQVNLSSEGQSQSVPVLAASQGQLKLAQGEHLSPGTKELRVTNTSTGQSTNPRKILFYEMEGNLERRKLASGNDVTQLVVKTRPANLRGKSIGIVRPCRLRWRPERSLGNDQRRSGSLPGARRAWRWTISSCLGTGVSNLSFAGNPIHTTRLGI
jgi:YD repeat-containing protein